MGMIKMKITKFPSLRENWRKFIVIFCLLLFLYLYVSHFLMSQNFYPSVDAEIFSRVLMDKQNESGFLESDSFDIPLLQYYSFWLYPKWPAFVSIIAGSLIFTFLILYILENFKTRLLKTILPMIFILLPSTLFVITNQPMIVLIIFFFSLTLYFLLEFYTTQRVFYLFMAAISFGLQFYIQIEFFWLGLLLIIFFGVTYYRTGLTVNYLISTLFPIVFFLLSYLFLIWIFKGDFSEFSRRFLKIDFQNGLQCLINCFLGSIKHRWPVLIFYLYVLFQVGRYKIFYRSPLFIAFISPFILMFIFGSAGIETTSSIFISLSIINFIILFPFLGPLINEKRKKKLILFFLMLILVFDIFSFWTLREDKEKDFFLALQGKFRDPRIEEYHQVADKLKGFSTILTDELSTYQIIFFYKGDGQFITTDSTLYQTALANPAYFSEAYLYEKTEGLLSLAQEIVSEEFPVKYYESETFVILSSEDK